MKKCCEKWVGVTSFNLYRTGENHFNGQGDYVKFCPECASELNYRKKFMKEVIMRVLNRHTHYEIFLEEQGLPLVRGSNPDKEIVLAEMKKYAKQHDLYIKEEIFV